MFRARFSAYLLPPDAIQPSTAAAAAAAGPLPCQFGVACRSGLDALVHAVDAHLQIHPASAFDRTCASLAAVRAHEHVAMLPTGYVLPDIHTALIDGSSQDTVGFDDDAAEA